MNLPTKIAKAPSGDFIGFSFAGVHSSDLGICRTSDGNRYNDTFLPTIQDKTIQVPGGDGTYYFGSYFTQKPFSIPIAFDCMTEAQYQYFKELFGDKKIHPLVFDDHPYKTYYVKVTGSPQLKTVCFDMEFDDLSSTVKDLYTPGQNESGVVRIYKGEGNLSFTAYYPYAESDYNYLEDYINAGWINYAEWAEASKLPENRIFYSGSNKLELQKFWYSSLDENLEDLGYSYLLNYIYNKTIPINWKARIPCINTSELVLTCYELNNNDEKLEKGKIIGSLTFSNLDSFITEDGAISLLELDTEKRLVKRITLEEEKDLSMGEVNGYLEKSEICNYKISKGDFFEIPNNGYYKIEITGYDNDNFLTDFPSFGNDSESASTGTGSLNYADHCFIDYKYRYL